MATSGDVAGSTQAPKLHAVRRGTLQVIPSAIIDDLVEGGDHTAWREGQWGKSFATISKHMRYRSGWYLVDDEQKSMFAMGIHGQNLFIDRGRKLVVAKLSSWKRPVDYLPLWVTHKSFEALRISLPRDGGRTTVARD